MRLITVFRWLLALAFLAVMAVPTMADRKPTAEERARIESVLREQGFTRWDEIEFDDDATAWDVDDAVSADGRKYDLKLDPNNLSIIKREESSSSSSEEERLLKIISAHSNDAGPTNRRSNNRSLSLDRSTERRILVQRQMRSRLIVQLDNITPTGPRSGKFFIPGIRGLAEWYSCMEG